MTHYSVNSGATMFTKSDKKFFLKMFLTGAAIGFVSGIVREVLIETAKQAAADANE